MKDDLDMNKVLKTLIAFLLLIMVSLILVAEMFA